MNPSHSPQSSRVEYLRVDQLVNPIDAIEYDELGHTVRVVVYSKTGKPAVVYGSLVAGDPTMDGVLR